MPRPRQPHHEIRRGLIVARIRRKQTRSGVRHTLTIVRLYRDGDVWKESSRFGTGDVPLMRLVLEEAYEWIFENDACSQA